MQHFPFILYLAAETLLVPLHETLSTAARVGYCSTFHETHVSDAITRYNFRRNLSILFQFHKKVSQCNRGIYNSSAFDLCDFLTIPWLFHYMVNPPQIACQMLHPHSGS